MISRSVVKVLGPSATPFVENFLTRNENFLEEKTLSTKLTVIGNYITLLHKEDYSKLIDIDPEQLLSTYDSFINNYKDKYTTDNYKEENKVILDHRVNGVGFYWVDLQREFSIESMVRLKHCGRANYGNTLLELREQVLGGNLSHLVIVYETRTGIIRQVKGKYNSKPVEKYYNLFYDFLINTDYKVTKYVPTYKPENDLKVEELPMTMQLNIYKKFPKLNKKGNLL